MERMVQKFIGFAGVGAVATIIQYGLLIVLHEGFSVYTLYASGSSYIVSAILNYLMKYYWVFRSKNAHFTAAPRYAVISLVGLNLNLLVMYLMVDMANLHYLIAQAAATLLVLFWGFFANAHWTFKH